MAAVADYAISDIIKKHLNQLKTQLEDIYKHPFTNEQVKRFFTYHESNYHNIYKNIFPNGYKNGGRHGKSRKHRSKGGRRGKSRKH